MTNLEKLIKNDNNTEIALLLQNPDILQMWMLVESNITDIEIGKEISREKGLESYLNYMLRIRDIEKNYKDLGNTYFKAYQDVLGQYGGWLMGDWISSEALDFYLEQDYAIRDKNINKEFLQKTNSQSLNSRGNTYDALSDIRDVLTSIIVSGHEKLKTIVPDDKELKELTVSVIRNYCKTFYTPTFLTNLRHEAVKLMGGKKYTHVERENWIDLLTNEDKFIKLGKLGNALEEYTKNSAEDARFEFYGEDRCKILDDNPMLMDIMLSVNYGLELFDLEGALNNYNLLFALNENNLQLFCEMILRRNVMLGMIEPELKKEFDAWLNIMPAQSEDSYLIDDLSEDARRGLLRKEIYPKLAKLLNDEVKPYVESTGTKATWDSVHFLFKLFGIVKPRFSRKNFAILVTQIVPGLGEASALESMMEKYDVGLPRSINGFDIDKASTKVATALRPFYDKFKNLCK